MGFKSTFKGLIVNNPVFVDCWRSKRAAVIVARDILRCRRFVHTGSGAYSGT